MIFGKLILSLLSLNVRRSMLSTNKFIPLNIFFHFKCEFEKKTRLFSKDEYFPPQNVFTPVPL